MVGQGIDFVLEEEQGDEHLELHEGIPPTGL